MSNKIVQAVTGAFGYSGKYITQHLLAQGQTVISLTNSVNRQNEFGGKVRAYPFNFENPTALVHSLEGVQTLYNTYWVRFNHTLFSHANAVANTLVLFEAAHRAGVERVVHISITNPSLDSSLEYFSGKAKLEQALINSGMRYAILRPTVLFGKEDILINNIAWALRHLPVFGVFGDGAYKLQPIYVEDLAALAVQYGTQRENVILNAIGPETYTYRELVQTIARLIGVRRMIVPVSPQIGYLAGKIIGSIVGDVMLTREEIQGLMANLLYVDTPPTGTTKLSAWVQQHAQTLGKRYTSELARRVNRNRAYQSN